jgi:hypothetical protein
VNEHDRLPEKFARYPQGPAIMPHQNNAAEWLMAAIVFPSAWAARLALKLIGRGDRRHLTRREER